VQTSLATQNLDMVQDQLALERRLHAGVRDMWIHAQIRGDAAVAALKDMTTRYNELESVLLKATLVRSRSYGSLAEEAFGNSPSLGSWSDVQSVTGDELSAAGSEYGYNGEVGIFLTFIMASGFEHVLIFSSL